MKRLFTLACLTCLYITVWAQPFPVDQCFLGSESDQLVHELPLKDGNKLLLIASEVPDSICYRLLKINPDNDLIWDTELGCFDEQGSLYNSMMFFLYDWIAVTPYDEVLYLHIRPYTVENNTYYVHHYETVDLLTGAVKFPLTVIDTFNFGYDERGSYLGVSALQSTGPGNYVLYRQEHRKNLSTDGTLAIITQYRITDHTNLEIRPLPVYDDVPPFVSSHSINFYQDDSLLLLVHYNGFDYYHTPPYVEMLDNRGESVAHFVFLDSLEAPESAQQLYIYERPETGQYVARWMGTHFLPDSVIRIDRLLLLDVPQDTVREIADLQPWATFDVAFKELNYYEFLKSPVFYFSWDGGPNFSMYVYDHDSLKLLNALFPVLNTEETPAFYNYFDLPGGDHVFLEENYDTQNFMYSYTLVKTDNNHQVTATYAPPADPPVFGSYFYYLRNSNKLLFVSDYNFDQGKTAIQLFDLVTMQPGTVDSLPLDLRNSQGLFLRDIYDDAGNTLYLLAQVKDGECFPGSDDVVIYKLEGELLSVRQQPAPVKSLQVFPNPATDFLTVELQEFNDTPVQLSIYDMTGKMIRRMNNAVQQAKFDVSGLPAGEYILLAVAESGSAASKIILAK